MFLCSFKPRKDLKILQNQARAQEKNFRVVRVEDEETRKIQSKCENLLVPARKLIAGTLRRFLPVIYPGFMSSVRSTRMDQTIDFQYSAIGVQGKERQWTLAAFASAIAVYCSNLDVNKLLTSTRWKLAELLSKSQNLPEPSSGPTLEMKSCMQNLQVWTHDHVAIGWKFKSHEIDCHVRCDMHVIFCPVND